MPFTTTAICVKCMGGYVLRGEDTRLLPTMQERKTPIPVGQPLWTWADWVWHITNYCPECRIQQPPRACLKDWEDHIARYRQNNG